MPQTPSVTTPPLWHPCTQMQQHESYPPLHISHAEGAYLFTPDGKKIIDAISSWWVNIHGHCNPIINNAIKAQLDVLEHVMLAGCTHSTIEELAKQLVSLTPPPLTTCFFADSGSAAVEIALKMSLQYWQQHGEPGRNTFLSLNNGYHGETLGSLSVSDIPLFSQQFHALLLQHLRAPSPDCSLKAANETEETFLRRQLTATEALMQAHEGKICALIVEPLIQGAAGMKMYPPIYLTWLRQLCDTYNIHLILDEIAVGFGRTGTLFAHEQAHISPDFLCLSKGLTAGYLPMSCVMTTSQIYQAFYSEDVRRGFLHSHSFTGNPLAATAALASLQLFKEQSILEKNQLLIACMGDELAQLGNNPAISHIRQTGMVAAFDVIEPSDNASIPLGKRIAAYALAHGVLIRPIGNSVYIMPPYCISCDEIKYIMQVLKQAISHALERSVSSKHANTVDISLP